MKANQSTILIVAGAAAALAYYFLFAKKSTARGAGGGAGGGGSSPTVVPVGTGGTISGQSLAQTAANAATQTASNLLGALVRSLGGGGSGGGSGAAAQIPLSRPGSSPLLKPADLSSSQNKPTPKADQIGGGGAGSATNPSLPPYSDISGTYTPEPNATSTNLPLYDQSGIYTNEPNATSTNLLYDQSGIFTNEPGPTSIDVPANEVPAPYSYEPPALIEGGAGYGSDLSTLNVISSPGLDLQSSDSGGGYFDASSGGDNTDTGP